MNAITLFQEAKNQVEFNLSSVDGFVCELVDNNVVVEYPSSISNGDVMPFSDFANITESTTIEEIVSFIEDAFADAIACYNYLSQLAY